MRDPPDTAVGEHPFVRAAGFRQSIGQNRHRFEIPRVVHLRASVCTLGLFQWALIVSG